jgi:hypothetical protein
MKTHKWIPSVNMQARTDPAQSQAGVTRTDPPGRAARGILILALMLGGLGAEGAITPGHSTGDQASTHFAAGNNRPRVSAHLTSSGHAKFNAWMY